MLNWLYFIESNNDYHNLMTFLMNEEDVNGISYLIFNDEVKYNDGKVFRKDNIVLISVNFFTHSLDPREKISKFGLNSDSLINFYDIICENIDQLAECESITDKANRIVWEKDLVKFLAKLHFKFKDNSILTVPESCVDYCRL